MYIPDDSVPRPEGSPITTPFDISCLFRHDQNWAVATKVYVLPCKDVAFYRVVYSRFVLAVCNRLRGKFETLGKVGNLQPHVKHFAIDQETVLRV